MIRPSFSFGIPSNVTQTVIHNYYPLLIRTYGNKQLNRKNTQVWVDNADRNDIESFCYNKLCCFTKVFVHWWFQVDFGFVLKWYSNAILIWNNSYTDDSFLTISSKIFFVKTFLTCLPSIGPKLLVLHNSFYFILYLEIHFSFKTSILFDFTSFERFCEK